MSELKKCPFCAEEIQFEAVKCRYCNEFLDESKRPIPVVKAEDETPLYLRTSFIALMFFIFPILALPSIWLHPKFHVGWKVGLTVLGVFLCWMTYRSYQMVMTQWGEATKALEGLGY